MVNEKLFSLDEANRLIPQLELLMEKMQRLSSQIRREIVHFAQGSRHCAHDITISQLLQLKPELRPLFEELERAAQTIAQLGGSFKGLELGLVDFPARIGGEMVKLCWQYGEKEIAYYHRRDEGFAGRRVLKQAGPRMYRH
ncbi:MAG: DUF2203 domain-containing protein [Deltaproteobacteria bacterium]|nr:DUF2203 domain-containing protein [Deltaproteobacteria bacterium]